MFWIFSVSSSTVCSLDQEKEKEEIIIDHSDIGDNIQGIPVEAEADNMIQAQGLN